MAKLDEWEQIHGQINEAAVDLLFGWKVLDVLQQIRVEFSGEGNATNGTRF